MLCRVHIVFHTINSQPRLSLIITFNGTSVGLTASEQDIKILSNSEAALARDLCREGPDTVLQTAPQLRMMVMRYAAGRSLWLLGRPQKYTCAPLWTPALWAVGCGA